MIQNTEVTLNDVSHHYDELDGFYRKLWGTHLHHGLWDNKSDTKEEAQENLAREVLSYLTPLEGKSLLDIGCGYGETARMAISLGAERVTGLTVSERQFEYARTHSRGYQIDYQLSDWLQSEFTEGSFDGAYSIECFEHVKDKSRYFQQVYHSLRPGGKFVMSAWLSSEEPANWEKKYILQPICEEGRLASLNTKEEVLNDIEESGLAFFDYIDLSDKVWRTWSVSASEVLKLLKRRDGIRYFMDKNKTERSFALTVLRILLGHRLGCFRYGLFVMYKPKR